MKPRRGIVVGIVLVGALGAAAYLRSGLLNLPTVRAEVTPKNAGLLGLDVMKATDAIVSAGRAGDDANGVVAIAALGVAQIRQGESEQGVGKLKDAVRADPANLVLGNALRMEVLQLKRQWMNNSADNGEIALSFPDYLHDEPVRFFRELVKTHPMRETQLQLALSLVDHMILFPALEIRAPASVESVDILTRILKDDAIDHAYYVPALYARGLNYLYRPFNLVWPERLAAAPDAASSDLATVVAIAQKVGVGSDALKAEAALTLGDAYAKEGRPNLARSWWQIANNMIKDDTFRERVFLRLQWRDEEIQTHLEQLFERQMQDIDHPLSDLRFIWL